MENKRFMKNLNFALILSVLYSLTTNAQTFSGGDGTSSNPFLISSKNDMAKLGENVNGNGYTQANSYMGKYFLLTTDITDAVSSIIGSIETKPFSGNFDGGNHTITFNGNFSSSSANSIGSNYNAGVGVFGYLLNATIKNLNVIGKLSSTNPKYAGGICGSASKSTITNCNYSGSVSSSNGIYVGGICGCSSETIISNCSNSGSVSFNIAFAGGICGLSSSTSKLMNCYNTGDITWMNHGNSFYDLCAGGICGRGYCDISFCYNTGGVFGVGGCICGDPYGIILGCVNIGNVVYAGFISKTQTAKIDNCYVLSGENISSFQSQSWIANTLGWDFNNVWKMSDINSVYKGFPIFKTQKDIFTNIQSVNLNNINDVSAFITNKGITINGCNPSDKVNIYSVNGQFIYGSVVGDGLIPCLLQRGTYIIQTTKKSLKVVY